MSYDDLNLMKKMSYNQQGDCLLKPIKSLPKNVKKAGGNVVLEGEVTGHAHRITEGAFELYKDGNDIFVKTLTECKISHEEHNTQTLQGDQIYWLDRVREIDPFEQEIRRVAD